VTASRQKECKHCGISFYPLRPMQRVCSVMCASRLVKAEKKEESERTKARKVAIKRIPDLIKEAQVAFNQWIRKRDQLAGYPCISSGKTLDWSGNATDAGHYRSTGAASHLRFNEDNCHAQSKHDNQYLAGNVVDYRINLINRIGLDRVEALEANNEPHKWTREELIEIKELYKRKLKELNQ
jgi:hypothetical protein